MHLPTDRAAPLPPMLRALLARAGALLPEPILHTGDAAARLTEAMGVPAFEMGGRIVAHPLLLRNGPDSRALHVLLHEAAHVLQRRASGTAIGPAPDAEAEAERFAAAVLTGQAAPPILARSALPRVQPFLPFLAFAAVCGVGIALTMYGARKSARDRAKGGVQRSPHLHETKWGYVPFVGSYDQMVNGDNWASQLGGAVFLVLDATGIGSLVAKTTSKSAAKGGLLFMTRQTSREALEQVAAGGGTALQREAYQELGEAAARGEISFGAEAATAIEKQLADSSGTWVVAGGTGWLNHSVTLLISNGRIFKLHGGVMRFAYPVSEGVLREGAGEAGAKLIGDGWLQRFNRFTVYAGDDLLTDAALREQVGWWARWSEGVGRLGVNHMLAPGCAGSQAILLERLGIGAAGGAGRFVPYLLDKGRIASGLGTSYVANTFKPMVANGIHAALMVGSGAALYETKTFLNIENAPTARAMEMFHSTNMLNKGTEATLIEPLDALSLVGGQWPTMFDVVKPRFMTFADKDPTAVQLNAKPAKGAAPAKPKTTVPVMMRMPGTRQPPPVVFKAGQPPPDDGGGMQWRSNSKARLLNRVR